ncbi:hypothetical protein D3C85_1736640 [compost metagenome]
MKASFRPRIGSRGAISTAAKIEEDMRGSKVLNCLLPAVYGSPPAGRQGDKIRMQKSITRHRAALRQAA